MGFYGLNVLVFPSGTELGLEINDALRFSPHVNLFAANGIDDYSNIAFNKVSYLPHIHDASFLKLLNEYIAENNIDIIFPTHDEVIYILSQAKNIINAKIINSDQYTARICRSKLYTYELFKNDWFCPQFFTEKNTIINFPILAKPDHGHGGKGIFQVRSAQELYLLDEKLIQDYIFVEFLPGEEVTVDCFTNRHGDLITVNPRKRNRILGSISASSAPLQDSEISDIADKINNTLNFRGGWFFQLKKDREDQWKLMEVSNRLSSSSVFLRAMGINLPLLSIHDLMERDLDVVSFASALNTERRYKTTISIPTQITDIYIDYDDTLIIDNKVNYELIAFLYKCLNNNFSVKLITRHKYDIYASLKKFKISPELFSEIIHLKGNEKKSDFVSNNSIFIDNHYLERKDVHDNTASLCFDADSSSFLI